MGFYVRAAICCMLSIDKQKHVVDEILRLPEGKSTMKDKNIKGKIKKIQSGEICAMAGWLNVERRAPQDAGIPQSCRLPWFPWK